MMCNKNIKIVIATLALASLFTFPTAQLAYSQGLSLDPKINLSNTDGSSAPYEVVAYGGKVYVVWLDIATRSDGSIESTSVMLKVSTDKGQSFGDAITLGSGTSLGIYGGPRIAVSGDNVYVVWADNKMLLFSRSTDGGSKFSIPTILGNTSKDSLVPWIAAYEKNVYAVWQDGIGPDVKNTEIFIRVSNDNGVTFGSTINLSNNESYSTFGNPWGPKIAAYRNDVYVVWQDLISQGNFDIFLAKSNDSGSTFDTINLSDLKGTSVHPTVATFGNNVYIAYQEDAHTGGQGANYDVFITRSTDRGESFESTIKMSSDGDAGDPKIVVSGKNVYIIWQDAGNAAFGGGSVKIFFARSTDGGKTFVPSINLSGNSWSVNAWLAASGNSVYVGWQEKVGNKFEVFFRTSTDYGVNFEPVINLSKGVGDSGSPLVAASEANVYVVWFDNGVGNGDIFVRSAINPFFKPDPTVAEIESETVNNPRTAKGSSITASFEDAINVYDTQPGFMAVSGGNVYALWTKDTKLSDGTVVGKEALFRAIKEDGSFISPTTKLNNNEKSQAESLVASGNNVYVVWLENSSNDASPKWDLFFSRNADSGTSFNTPVKLSSGKGAYEPQIVVSGTNVYALWMEGEVGKADILLSRSTDNGSTFNDPINLGTGWSPHIAVSNNNVYVVWQNGDIFFKRSIDNGAKFGSPINLSNDAGASISPRLAVSGNNVYIVWADDVVSANTPAKRDILFAKSTDNGSTFASPINLSNSGDADFAKIVATGNNVYVEWFKGSNAGPKLLTVSKDNGNTFDSVINLTEKIATQISGTAYYEKKVYAVWMSNGNVFLGESKDFGVSFESKINLSSNGRANIPPSIIISDNKLYVIWGEVDNFVFRVGKITKDTVQAPSPLPAPIAINHISNSKPRWDLDTVAISGIVSNPSSLDTITIDWGDNTISNVRIIQQNGSWGPVGHTYDVEHVGKKQIVAKLFSGRMLKANSTYEIDVQKHATSITIDPISKVQPSSSIMVTGSLFDEDAKTGISGRIVTFDGTGASDLSRTVTFKDGMFSSKGTAPDKASTGLTIQAHFAGGNVYLPSHSNIVTYDTKSTEEKPKTSDKPKQTVVPEKSKENGVSGLINVQMKQKNGLTLISVKNNSVEDVSEVKIKASDGNVKFVKARGWDRERVNQSTVIVSTDDKPITSGRSLIIMLITNNVTSLEWSAVNESGVEISRGILSNT